MQKESKIYIAGHNGMVGSALTRILVSLGYTNLIFTPFPPNDLTDQKTVADFFEKEKPEYVFLAAAKVGSILSNNTYRGEFIYDNLMIQNNVIHQSYLNGVKKLLFLGSSCVYPKNCPQPIKEEYLLTSELEYTNEPYAVAKIAGIKMCEAYNIQYGTNYISVMPTNLYGSNDNYNLETSHVLPALIRKMHLGKCLENNDWAGLRKDMKKYPITGIDDTSSESTIVEVLAKYGISYSTQHPATSTQYPAPGSPNLTPQASNQVSITLWGTGSPYREFLYVDDMVDACIFLMENVNINDIVYLHTGKTKNDTVTPVDHKNRQINIGSGIDQTIAELADTVKRIIGFNGSLEWDSSKPDGTLRKLLDVTNIKKLGWKEKVNLSEGIGKVYKIYST